jgi:hypothetical protein
MAQNEQKQRWENKRFSFPEIILSSLIINILHPAI